MESPKIRRTKSAVIASTKFACGWCDGTGLEPEFYSPGEKYRNPDFGKECSSCRGRGYRYTTEKQSLWLCVGGPYALQKRTEAEAGSNYVRFNSSSRRGRNDKTPSALLIWTGFFQPGVL